MIKAIFYSKFDTQEGPKVVHQVPDGAIVPTASSQELQPPLLTFSDISFFVIPRQELCGNLLQVCTNGNRILGYPICIKSHRYDRNEFIFNFCLVLAEEEDFSTYKSVVQKLADLMRELEEQSGFLSRDHSKGGGGKVYSLCETLMEDLNNYCESMIPIDDLNTLNVKLFPVYPAPPSVKAWQVPLFTVRYQAFMDENWDLTMQRVVPYINGVNSVRIISILADTDFSLTCRAIRHLLYYGCLLLLDIFSFSAIYAPTAQFSSTIASDEDMQRECARYVNTRFAPQLANPPTTAPGQVPAAPWTSSHSDVPARPDSPDTTGTGGGIAAAAAGAFGGGPSPFDPDELWPPVDSDDIPNDTTTNNNNNNNNTTTDDTTTTITTTNTTSTEKPHQVVDGVTIVELYASLKQGQSVKQWYAQHSRHLANIDIRRFITFGIIKGFLYRVHKYAYDTGFPAAPKHDHHNHNHNHNHYYCSHLPGMTSGLSSRGPGTGANSPYASSVGDGTPGAGSGSGTATGAGTPTNNNLNQQSTSVQSQSMVDYRGEGEGEGDGDAEDDFIDDKSLVKYLDGMHCFDQICTELEVSERELTARLKRYPGEVLIIHR